MRFQRIIEALYTRPLDITVAGFQGIDAIVRPHLKAGALKAADFGNFEPGKTDLMGSPLPETLTWEGDIAVIYVCGPLVQHGSLLDKSCGATSYQDIAAALKEGAQGEGILMHFNSPGGEHVGCMEVAEKIMALKETGFAIDAFFDTLMCSAAYELACGCRTLYGTRTGMTGSIGSIIGFLDSSKAYEMEGLKPVIFASGKYKGTGQDGVALSEEQADYLQELVDSSAEVFKDHVRSNRPEVEEETMEGQVLYGEAAADCGLVDELVSDLEECLEAIS